MFTLDREQIEVGTGDFVYVSRGTRHGFAAGEDAKALLLTVPAGLAGFLKELGTGIAAGKTSESCVPHSRDAMTRFPAPKAKVHGVRGECPARHPRRA